MIDRGLRYPEISAKVIIINDNKALLIKRRLLDPYAPGRWDIPGGGSGPGEDALQTVLRELLEEVGYEAKEEHLELHSEEEVEKPKRRYRRHTFIHRADEQFVPKLSREHSEFRWMPIEEVVSTNLPDHYKVVCQKILV